MQDIKKKILSEVARHGRGWTFSQKDLAHLGSRSEINNALLSLVRKRVIRRVLRGIYDYPSYSKALKQESKPDIHKVAQAIARRFDWKIRRSSPAVKDTLTLSARAQETYLYLSDGPNRTYTVGTIDLVFHKDKGVEIKILGEIDRHGRGWVFSQKDLVHLGSRASIDYVLHHLVRKRIIRRIIRGIYDYPIYSKRLEQHLSPDIDKVAQAFARKSSWDIQPSGPSALNILGLSTQVPGKYLYLSSGPHRSYDIDKSKLIFRHVAQKEIDFTLYESRIVVPALKSLGRDSISINVINSIREWLDPTLRGKLLMDTKNVTGWVYDAIRKICENNPNG